MILGKAIKKGLTNWLNEQEDKLIGGALFSNGESNQVFLFEKFGICTQNNLSLKSEITNHYIEENAWVNDHWAISPPQYVLSGLIGELIYTVPEGWAKRVESVYGAIGLGILSKLCPSLGSYTSSALNIARKAESVVQKYINIAKSAGNKIANFLKRDITSKTNQRRVLDELENLMNNRILVNVSTPYGTYKGLAIISINVRQDQSTRFMSDIEITFQKWRNPGEDFNKASEEKSQSEIATAQKSTMKNKGLIGSIKQEYDILNNKIISGYEKGATIA